MIPPLRKEPNEAQALRRMAQWHREFAAVGSPDLRQSRLEWADYLDRLALDKERAVQESALTPSDAPRAGTTKPRH
jgi:hypothetical protein